MPTPIANAEHGAVVTLAGTIRRARLQVRSPISERPCVYWAELSGLRRREPVRFDGADFWIEDATGKALVRVERARVGVRAQETDAVVALIDADIGAVSERIRELKRIRKRGPATAARAAMTEHKQLKKVATLLCAMRAHARGNVHVGGTLDGQAAYIRERSATISDNVAPKSLELFGKTYEVRLEDGQDIRVTGLCEEAFIPPDVGPVGGYRDAPTCIQIRAPDGEDLVITGVGELEPLPPPAVVPPAPQALAPRRRSGVGRAVGWAVVIGVLWALMHAFLE